MYYKLENLSALSGDVLGQAFAAVPENVTLLDASWSDLNQKVVGHLRQAFARISGRVRSLDLSGNSFGNQTAAELVQEFGGIPETITALNLSGNFLYEKTTAELIQVFRSFSKNMAFLNLSTNHFSLKSTEDLTQILGDIPVGVTSLDVSRNDLDQKNTADLIKVFSGMSDHITEITISFSDIQNRTPDELIALGKTLSHVTTLHVIDESGDPVSHPSVYLLRKHIGAFVLNAYNELIDNGLFPTLARLLLEEKNGAKKQIVQFILDRTPKETDMQAELTTGSEVYTLVSGTGLFSELQNLEAPVSDRISLSLN
jgi:hypothetical protein